MTIIACIKWVLPNRDGDERFAGISLADQAALETALSIAEVFGDDVTVVAAGPSTADTSLRDAIACGASHAMRIDVSTSTESAEVARLLASVAKGARLIVCGDYSSDRGSGSVPAFIAAELGLGQALGLIDVRVDGGAISVKRRLDGGRRESLVVEGPAVISVEGSVARLRRAPLRASLAAANAEIDVVTADNTGAIRRIVDNGQVRPYRPRARVIPSPIGESALDRVRRVTDTSGSKGHGETVHLEPRAAAERILHSLRDWGYLAE
jgi:electron transfer flavoprotein beta subunit